MKDDVYQRVIDEARYILKKKDTVRGTAKIFNVGKSTVHKDLTFRLEQIDTYLYFEVKKLLNVNLSERHLRGGLATRKMYLEKSRKDSFR